MTRLLWLVAIMAALVILPASLNVAPPAGTQSAKATSPCDGGCNGGGDACAPDISYETTGSLTNNPPNFRIGYISVITCNHNNVTVSGTACTQIKVVLGNTVNWQDIGASCSEITNKALVLGGVDAATMSGRAVCSPTNTSNTYRGQVYWAGTFPDGTVKTYNLTTSNHTHNCYADPFQ